MSKTRDYKQQPINVMDIYELILMSDLFPRATGKLVALRVLKYDGQEKGTASFSQKYVAEKMGVSGESIRKTLVHMEDLDLINRKKSQGGTTDVEINWLLWKRMVRSWQSGKDQLPTPATTLSTQLPTPDRGTSQLRKTTSHMREAKPSKLPTPATTKNKGLKNSKEHSKEYAESFSQDEKRSADFDLMDYENSIPPGTEDLQLQKEPSPSPKKNHSTLNVLERIQAA